MRNLLRSSLLVLALATVLPLAARDFQESGAGAAAAAWQADVSAIAAAGDNAARLAAIARRLQAAGFEVTESPFSIDGRDGLNLLAPVAGSADAPLLLLGAHADRVEQGEGAVDNASGSAVVLALAQRLRERPLARHRVAVAFWDLEEQGLLGARAHVADGGEKPALYVNFDVFGWGDTLWLMSPDPAHPLVVTGKAAARDASTGFSSTTEHYPPTDHLAFLRAGWPAVSYSLLDADEIRAIEAMLQGQRPQTPPRVMRVIHTAEDTQEQLDPAAVARGIDAVEAALRAWDAQPPAEDGTDAEARSP